MVRRTPKLSAGILLYRSTDGYVEVLLAHPGGPYFAKRDQGAWSIPKGELNSDDEDLVAAARREFCEETGMEPTGRLQALGYVKQRGGKEVHAWAMEGDFDPAQLNSNTFRIEWPYRSGRSQEFPEIDRVGWFSLEDAARKANIAQVDLLERLRTLLRQ